jgi:hypothetical protein
VAAHATGVHHDLATARGNGALRRVGDGRLAGPPSLIGAEFFWRRQENGGML